MNTTQPLTTGSGDYQYEVQHDWGEVPPEIRYGNTHGIVEDFQGYLYVFHTVHATSPCQDAMVVFDPDGRFVRSWGSEFAGGGAHGIHLAREGGNEYFYLCDIRRRMVVKTTLHGEEVFRIGFPVESEAYRSDPKGVPGPKYDDCGNVKYKPTNLAIAPNGDIYVADGYGASYINRYDRQGRWLSTFGGPGSGPGELLVPHGIWIDTRDGEPKVLVADRSNRRLQYFTLEGEHLSFVEGVDLPCHFHERDGIVLIPDLAARVTLLGRDNQVLAHLGQGLPDYRQRRLLPRDHFLPGRFICPHGANFDRAGNIFVAEWVETGRVTKLVRIS